MHYFIAVEQNRSAIFNTFNATYDFFAPGGVDLFLRFDGLNAFLQGLDQINPVFFRQRQRFFEDFAGLRGHIT